MHDKYRLKHSVPFEIIFRVFLGIFHVEMCTERNYKEKVFVSRPPPEKTINSELQISCRIYSLGNICFTFSGFFCSNDQAINVDGIFLAVIY